MEISADYVASLRASATHPLALENLAYVLLPQGAVSPSYTRPNVADGEALGRALENLVERNSLRKEVNLLIPDLAARVFLINLESLPSKPAELIQLLQFKIKKNIPFSIEDAALSYQVQTLTPSHHEVALTVVNRDILREYESAVEGVDLEPGFVTVAHFGIAQLLDGVAHESRSRSMLLFRLSPGAFTTSIYHHGHLRFYRAVEKDYSVARPTLMTPEALFNEVYPSLAYFQDKFESQIEMIYFSGLPAGGRELCAAIQALSDCPVAEIFAERAVGKMSTSLTANQMNQVFAPLVGVELGAA